MGSGRKRIEFRKVEKLQNRRVTFTKRRQGLIKKAEQLSSLTGCTVAALFFSPSCLNPILYGDLSLLEQAASAADADSSVASIHRHSTTKPASLFADCFQEQSPSVGCDNNLVDQESLLLLTTSAGYEKDQEELCRRQELLHQMYPCKPLQMIVPAIENNYYHSASSSYYYSNIQKNNNYGAEDQMKMVTREAGSSSRRNTNLLVDQGSLLLTACEEDQEEEWRRKELLQMDDHSGCNNIQNKYNRNDCHHSYSLPYSCIGAGGRDMGMVTMEVGSSSRNATDINNNANGLMNEEAQQQQLALSLAADDLADSLCMAKEGADLNQLKQRFEAVRQSLLDKLMMADAALSLLS